MYIEGALMSKSCNFAWVTVIMYTEPGIYVQDLAFQKVANSSAFQKHDFLFHNNPGFISTGIIS